jgi:hypothetical protein
MRGKNMSGVYRNGGDQEIRPPCQSAGEWEPLRRDALRVTSEGKPALILGTLPASLHVAALILEGTTLRFQNIKEMDLRHPMTVFPFNQQKVLRYILDLALQKAFVYRTRPEISTGNLLAPGFLQEGRLHAPQWIEKDWLVCTQCGGYVCRCGGCLCYDEGQKKYRTSLSLRREVRVEYLRAIGFCSANIETRPKAKILRFPRKKKSPKY